MADAQRGAAFLDEEAANKPKCRNPREYLAEVRELWQQGLPRGDLPGWPSVDRLYSVLPGQLTVITGWPGSGKSEFLDAMLVNLSRRGWHVAMFSPENQPVKFHISKLLEKAAHKPFGSGPTERMTLEEIDECTDEIAQHFGFIDSIRGTATVREVVSAAEPFLKAVPEGGKRGLVIDPWNELEHWRPANLSETEYVSATLSWLRNWARAKSVHVWIVAHPAKMPRDKGKLPLPKPDMIAGSSHWWNKADCALAVVRDFEEESRAVDIYVQKIRFKHVGRIGRATLEYDRVTGTYHQPLRAVSDRKMAAAGDD